MSGYDKSGHSDVAVPKQYAVWHRANAFPVPDGLEEGSGDTVSQFVAVSNGYIVGRARWHYPTKSWCHKGDYGHLILFWSLLPSWDSAPDELSAADYEEVLAGHRVLVRELDVQLNGERGAAKQASLCDLVGQLRHQPPWKEIEGDRDEWKRIAAARNVVIGTLGQENEALKARVAELTEELRDHMWWERTAVELQRQRDELHAHVSVSAPSFQARVADWMHACFSPEIATDCTERNHRFLEEALELVQAGGCSKSEALQLVDYVYGRPAGVMAQEVGGVMVTLEALGSAFHLDVHLCAEEELTRIWHRMPEIRAKQAGKPKYSALPESPAATDHHPV